VLITLYVLGIQRKIFVIVITFKCYLPFLILSQRRTISSPPLALHVRRLSRQMLRLWTSSETHRHRNHCSSSI